MKNKLNHILSMGGILIGLGVASASAQTTVALKASIPFSFKVQEAALPAGDYTITFFRNENWGGVVWLKSADGKTRIKVFAADGTAKRLQEKAYLAFNQYGDEHFLSQIWTGSDRTGKELPKSQAEREVMLAASKGEAQPGSAPRQVTIAAR